MLRLLPLSALLAHGGLATAGDVPRAIDLAAKPEGCLVLDAGELTPDPAGVLAKFELVLPAYQRAVYYQSGWWPAGANRVYSHLLTPAGGGKVKIREVNEKRGAEGGLFAIFEKDNGEYLALLPLAGNKAYAWLATDGGKTVARPDRQAPTESFNDVGGKLCLKLGHQGIARVSGAMPVCLWATAANPYEAASKVWRKASETDQMKGALKMRGDKTLPEPLLYLGWCSWDCLRMGVTSESLCSALEGLAASAVPIRWALLDDGHYDKASLLNNEKFPQSYGPMMKCRADDKIKWMGIWYAEFGNFGGTKVNPSWDGMKDHFKVVGSRMMPKQDPASGKAYFRYIFREGTKHGLDVLKTDFQTYNINFFRGRNQEERTVFPNPYAASVVAQKAFHEVVQKDYKALINCNWHNAACVFKSHDSVVGRCSEDNRGGEQDAITHTFHSFASTPWLGQVAWGDHDMFHSGDKSLKAARFNVVAKAMSGGPVYLSELADKVRTDLVTPLIYLDGRVLRPLAPSAPLAEDLFHQLYDDRLYAASAPLTNQSALFFVYSTNRKGPLAKKAASRKLTMEDYRQASAMIQPYPGPWPAPQDGVLVYDRDAGTAGELGDGFDVTLKGFGFKALQMSPITDGVSILGRVDKYLPAAAVSDVRGGGAEWEIDLAEAGPFGVWCREGKPQAAGLVFEDRGKGLYVAAMPVKAGAVTIRLRISESQ